MHKPLRVLMELRPCVEGFAGIPQETRLLFSSFLDLPNIETFGLINHGARRLAPGLSRRRSFGPTTQHRKINRLSRVVISHNTPPQGLFANTVVPHIRQWLALSTAARLDRALPIYDFDAEHFRDFIWDALFSKTLPTSEFQKITNARYRSIRPSWHAMHRTGIGAVYPKFDTVDYDVLMTQTPFPGRVKKNTQLVVRYHDAIPIFLPQMVPNIRFHQASHFHALRANARRAVFVCTTNAVRADLLSIFPAVEKRSVVIHDIISHDYFLEERSPYQINEIIRNRLNEKSEPEFQAADKTGFYDSHLQLDKMRYVLMVSTIEPRKNHVRMIRAWELLRAKLDPELKLVICGEFGWNYTAIVEAMRPWQGRGELFHVHKVPSAELRLLFRRAACVVCPSIAEGFDLSGIEAMMCGGVVAASDIAVHREVYGDAAAYFDPYSVSAQAEAIESIIAPERQEFVADLRARSIRQAQNYKRGAIVPQWDDFFDRLGAGAFADDGGVIPVLGWRPPTSEARPPEANRPPAVDR